MISRKHIRLLAIFVLIVGFGIAFFIYFTADPPPGNAFGYDPLSTKKYVHELKRFGGTFAVLSAEFSRWLTSLWQGKQLAFTTGFISLSLASLLWFIGSPPSTRHQGD